MQHRMQLFLKNVSFALLIVLLTGCEKAPSSEPSNQDEKVDTGEIVEVEKPPEPLVLHRWKNVPVSYQFVLGSQLKDQDGISLLSVAASGPMRVQLVAAERNRVSLQVRIGELELLVEGVGVNDKQVNQAREELGQPVRCVLQDGRLSSFVFPAAASPLAVTVWRTLVSALQSSGSPRGEVPYLTVEYDVKGEYTVQYARGAGEGVWKKTKQLYSRGLFMDDLMPEMGSASPVPILEQSEGEVVFDGKGLKVVREGYTVRIPLLGGETLQSHRNVELSRTAPGAMESTSPLRVDGAIHLRADEPYRLPVSIAALDARRLKGRRLGKLIESLETRAREEGYKRLFGKTRVKVRGTGDDWIREWLADYAALSSFFRQRPTSVPQMEKPLRKGSNASPAILGALAASGVPSAQKLLVKLGMDESLDPRFREMAIRNLVQSRRPTKETAAVIQGFYSHPYLAPYAVFGTGLIARQFKQNGQSVEAAERVDWLLGLLTESDDPAKRRDILRGLSNTASPIIFDAVKPLLGSDEPVERAGAVEAIRMLDHPAVDGLVAAKLNPLNEKSEIVRLAAVGAAEKRAPADPVREGIIQAATLDPDPRVRSAAGKVLQTWAKRDSSLQAVLEGLQG